MAKEVFWGKWEGSPPCECCDWALAISAIFLRQWRGFAFLSEVHQLSICVDAGVFRLWGEEGAASEPRWFSQRMRQTRNKTTQ
ncbi:hypothetical protein [Corynebacterium aquilae]|uniref:hypothetical protein n=1 Tax=Corynebacterium aquilae TaxID=203263 RepID=UPI0012EE92A3|nr:hypothetical protein [Corynebacterium aquilae]